MKVKLYICIVIIAVITNKEIRGNTINRLDLAATKSGLFNFMEIEIWKDIPGYEEIYQVSNLGNVKSLKFGDGKLMKPTNRGRFYMVISLCKCGVVKNISVHQLVAMAFLGHMPDSTQKIVVDHINNIRSDNRLVNLQLITQRQNLSKDKKTGSSKYVGVSWCNRSKKWISIIYKNKKSMFLGRFINEIDAHLSYQKELSKT